MIEPMLARLAGCLVFGGLLAGLVLAVDQPSAARQSDVVAAAEVQHRAEAALFTRP